MLRGELVGLRGRLEADIPILDAELHNDVAAKVRSSRRPWRPHAPGGSASEYSVKEPDDSTANFSVITLADDELAGVASLWGIDSHNRLAHLGIALRPAARGKGLGTDIVRVLCHYGFVLLGLHRLQVDTLADNTSMIKAAVSVGFREEGVNREAVWVAGEFLDEVVLGMLVSEWSR
jgi:RimJ/RimL family protein N-acetyltransferase